MTVTGGHVSPPYINMNNASAGMVRYNGNSFGLEIYDGSSWMTWQAASAHIDMSPNAQAAINWAYEKMNEEHKLKELMTRHPGLKDLHDKFEMLKVLCEQEENKHD